MKDRARFRRLPKTMPDEKANIAFLAYAPLDCSVQLPVRNLNTKNRTSFWPKMSNQTPEYDDFMQENVTIAAHTEFATLRARVFGPEFLNFEGLPLIHSATGFWIVFAVLLGIGVGMSMFFWRKRYLRRN